MASDLSNPAFTNENAARKWLERNRWPNGAVCPFCKAGERVKALKGKSMGPGWYHCSECREKFTVRVGTLYERSHIPLHKWLLATHLVTSGKNGVSAHELHRMLKITYKSAWFMAHRIREAMIDLKPGPMGATGGNIQADETYHLNTSRRAKGYKKGHSNKAQILALVDEDKGKVRAFHVKGMTADKTCNILFTNVMRKATLVTDESRLYTFAGSQFADHQTVLHTAREYVSKAGFTTNNVENFFGVFKRGMRGTYTFCGEQHLQRYLAEFQFRYNNRSGLGVTDGERAAIALKGIEGKRLTYRSAH